MIWMHLAILPAVCPAGHAVVITPKKKGKVVFIKCTSCTKDDTYNGPKGRGYKTTFCPFGKKSWRRYPGPCAGFPNSVQPRAFLRLLFWFAQRLTMDQVREYTGLPTKTCATSVHLLRQILTKIVMEESSGERMGGPGKVVQVDETYFTKPKRNRAGFGGRTTKGHEIKVLGFIELDLETRTCTGRTYLERIPAADRPTIESRIRARVLPGSMVWTDGHLSYKWMGKAGSGYT